MLPGTTGFSFSYNLTPWVKRLLIANVVVYILTLVDQEFFFRWFAFVPAQVLLQPWGAVTYMFLHGSLTHLLLNMLMLFFFGPPLEARWGSGEFIKFYFLCGLGGVVFSFFFAYASAVIGASGAIYGLLLAFALTWPESPIYIWLIFPVKAKWLVAFLFVVSWMSAFGSGGGNIAHFAHLGGIVSGFLYLKRDWRPGPRPKGRKQSAGVRRMVIVPRQESSRKQNSGGFPPSQPPPEEMSSKEESMLDEVDRILDKISAEGMGALTSDERKTLDHVSRQHRSN